MDDDEFYDSIDEDSTAFGFDVRPNPVDLSAIVPLYNGETHKEDLKTKLPRRAVKKVSYDLPQSKLDGRAAKSDVRLAKSSASKSSMFSASSVSSVLDVKPKKSYLNIFHAKIGYVQGGDGKTGSDTTRGMSGGDTLRSGESEVDSSSEFSDAHSFVSDTSSFYIKYMEDEKQRRSCQTKSTEKLSSTSLTDSAYMMKSVSEYSLSNNDRRARSKPRRTSSSKKFVSCVPAALGGLGPDPEAVKDKFQNFKKQQTYGQKVSNQNRIKMMERQVIRNFKVEMKRSSELNRCTETVLQT